MAINFDEAFTKNYMETMYPQEPEQPEPEVQLASANTGVMTDGGIAPIPRNKAQEALGFVGQMLTKAGVQLDKVGLDVPVLGKITLNDLLIGESGRILEDMSYGFMPTGKSRMEDRGVVVGPSGERRVSGLSGSAPMLDPSVIDVAGLPFVGVGAKAALKGTKKIIEAGKDLPVGMSVANATVKDVSNSLMNKYDGLELDLYDSKNTNVITLSKIVVPKNLRKSGIGSDVMAEITSFADEGGKTIALSPSVDFGGTSVNRLKDFYKQFGFVENKGKNKDFSISESMYRLPKSKNIEESK